MSKKDGCKKERCLQVEKDMKTLNYDIANIADALECEPDSTAILKKIDSLYQENRTLRRDASDLQSKVDEMRAEGLRRQGESDRLADEVGWLRALIAKVLGVENPKRQRVCCTTPLMRSDGSCANCGKFIV